MNRAFLNRAFPFFIALSLISWPGAWPAAWALGPTGQSVAINIAGSTTTQLVAPAGATQIYVTGWDVLANTASSFSLEYGKSVTTPCDTGATAVTGVYNFAAQSGISRSGGDQPLYVIPQGNALCAVTSGPSVSVAGSLSYTQF